jgi:hypothetical protein
MSLSQPIVSEICNYLDAPNKYKMAWTFNNMYLLDDYHRKIISHINDRNNLVSACKNKNETLALELINIYLIDSHNKWIMYGNPFCVYYHACENQLYNVAYKLLDIIDVNMCIEPKGMSIIEYTVSFEDMHRINWDSKGHPDPDVDPYNWIRNLKFDNSKLIMKMLKNPKLHAVDELSNMMIEYMPDNVIIEFIDTINNNYYELSININTIFEKLMVHNKIFIIEYLLLVLFKIDNSKELFAMLGQSGDSDYKILSVILDRDNGKVDNYIKHVHSYGITLLDWLMSYKPDNQAKPLIQIIIKKYGHDYYKNLINCENKTILMIAIEYNINSKIIDLLLTDKDKCLMDNIDDNEKTTNEYIEMYNERIKNNVPE